MSDNSESARLVELDMSVIAGHEAEHLRSEILRLQSELSEAKARVEELEKTHVTISSSEFAALSEALDNPQEPNENLKSLMAHQPPWSEPEGRDDCVDLLQRAAIKSGMLRMGERIAFGSDADIIDELSKALAEARANAIEECAKVAAGFDCGEAPASLNEYDWTAGCARTSFEIAKAIRYLNGGKI